MTLTWDELDQLADYGAGLLRGADADRIGRLITTDPRWAAAHTTLQRSEATITAALHTAADHTPPAPRGLAHQIAGTLAQSSAPRVAATRPLPPRRRPVLVAACAVVLLLVCGVGGIVSLRNLPGTTAGDNENAAPPVPSAGASGGAVDGAEPHLFASGTDYRQETLREMAVMVPQSYRDLDAPQLSAGPLAELITPAGFAACAAAVRSQHPGVVQAADFARFEGTPAVILRVEGEGTAVIVAVDPACGTDGDPHELASVEVG